MINLGNDTLITISESLLLNIDDSFSNVLWSTGDTTPSIIINGEDFDEGIFKFWVDAYNGDCPVSDSILIEIIDNSTVFENKGDWVKFYPNPASSRIYFHTNGNRGINEINIFNQVGEKVIHQVSVDDYIDITSLRAGVYILEIVINNERTNQKLVIRK